MKILFYDIETSPNIAYVWGKYQQDVIDYKQERELLSFAYSYLGEKEIHCITRQGEKTDKKLVIKVCKLMQEADITVAHNGDEFDRKIIKARMLKWGLKPLKINCSVDTKKAAKTYFGFNGNGLDAICKFLSIGHKKSNPGFQMWLGCMAGDNKAWKQMISYNKHDIVILKALYQKLRPWIENHPNIARLIHPTLKLAGVCCPDCRSFAIIRKGIRTTQSTANLQWLCKGCGKWFKTSVPKDYKPW